jgi:putative MATE family efflux protein
MKDLTTGSVTRHLLQTAGFMLVTMVFQTLYFLVDLYWVGRLGPQAVAGVGVGGNLMFVVLAGSQMLGVGATTLIAHAVGRQDHPHAQRVFHQGVLLAAGVAVVFAAVAMPLRGAYSVALAADAATARQAAAYLAWFVPALALQFPMVVMAAALRGTGNFKPGMLVQTATVVVNIALAPVLMFGWLGLPALGVAGAALATWIAVLLGTAWLATFFVNAGAYLRFHGAGWRPEPKLWGAMLRIGVPAGAEFALMGIYLVAVYAISRPFGAAAQAGFGIGMRIMQAGFMPVVALGFAVAPVAGQNVGAHHPERVRATLRSALTLAAGIMAVFALLCHIAPAAMIGWFSNDPRVVAVGDEYLRILSWNFVAAGVAFVSSSMFQALGNTWPSLLASLARIGAILVPALWLARAPGFQLRWIWYLAVAGVTLQAAISLLLLRRELKARLDAPRAFQVPAAAAGETRG